MFPSLSAGKPSAMTPPIAFWPRRGQKERVETEADLILRLRRSLPASPVVDDGEAVLFRGRGFP